MQLASDDVRSSPEFVGVIWSEAISCPLFSSLFSEGPHLGRLSGFGWAILVFLKIRTFKVIFLC